MTLHFQREIKKLKKMIFKEADFVEKSLKQALQALNDKDIDLAEKIIKADNKLDQMEIDVEEEALKILALHQPVAIDLRFIISVIKLNNDLERIGDLTSNIAERVKLYAENPDIKISENIFLMADITENMVKETLNALVNMDKEKAANVCQQDDQVDELHKKMYLYVKEKIRGEVKNPDVYLQQIGISRYLERIADHATNIAEDVIYMVSGKISRHKTI